MSYHIKAPRMELIELDDRGVYHTPQAWVLDLILANRDVDGPPAWVPDPAYWEAARMAKVLHGVVVEDPHPAQAVDKHGTLIIF